jgi:hypothetical protein
MSDYWGDYDQNDIKSRIESIGINRDSLESLF